MICHRHGCYEMSNEQVGDVELVSVTMLRADVTDSTLVEGVKRGKGAISPGLAHLLTYLLGHSRSAHLYLTHLIF